MDTDLRAGSGLRVRGGHVVSERFQLPRRGPGWVGPLSALDPLVERANRHARGLGGDVGERPAADVGEDGLLELWRERDRADGSTWPWMLARRRLREVTVRQDQIPSTPRRIRRSRAQARGAAGRGWLRIVSGPAGDKVRAIDGLKPSGNSDPSGKAAREPAFPSPALNVAKAPYARMCPSLSATSKRFRRDMARGLARGSAPLRRGCERSSARGLSSV